MECKHGGLKQYCPLCKVEATNPDKRKTVEALTKAFSMSVAAFEAVHTIAGIFATVKPEKSFMHKLHMMTRDELLSDEPCLQKVDKYFELMESLTILQEHERENKNKES